MDSAVTQTAEQEAQAFGISRSTLQRVRYIHQVAEAPDGAVPDIARRAAREILAGLAAGGISIRDSYETVRYIVERQTVRSWECVQCGGEITDRDHRPDARYCSPACRQKAYRARARSTTD